jgi:hypothetical protein
LARIGLTIVDVDTTQRSRKARETRATSRVRTDTIGLARISQSIRNRVKIEGVTVAINESIAVRTSEPRWALTSEASNAIDTSGAILAGLGGALVNVDLAINSLVAIEARTGIPSLRKRDAS